MHALTNWSGRAGWLVGLVFGMVGGWWMAAAAQSYGIVCLHVQPCSRKGGKRGNAL